MTNCDNVKYQDGASFLLATLGRRAERAWNAFLAKRSVTTAQFAAIAALSEGEKTQAQVAMVTAVDPRNMAVTIKGLIEKNWVQVRPNPEDARSRLVSLTPVGEEWWSALQPELRRERENFFQALTDDDFVILERLLRNLEASHAVPSVGAVRRSVYQPTKD